jgi:hypothetical protein
MNYFSYDTLASCCWRLPVIDCLDSEFIWGIMFHELVSPAFVPEFWMFLELAGLVPIWLKEPDEDSVGLL